MTLRTDEALPRPTAVAPSNGPFRLPLSYRLRRGPLPVRARKEDCREPGRFNLDAAASGAFHVSSDKTYAVDSFVLDTKL